MEHHGTAGIALSLSLGLPLAHAVSKLLQEGWTSLLRILEYLWNQSQTSTQGWAIELGSYLYASFFLFF